MNGEQMTNLFIIMVTTMISKAEENGMHCAVNMLRSFIKLKLSVSY